MNSLILSVQLPETISGNFSLETSDPSIVLGSSRAIGSFCESLAIIMVKQISSSKPCWMGEYIDLDVKIFGWEFVKSRFIIKSSYCRNPQSGYPILFSDSRLRFYHIEDDVFYTAASNCLLSPYWLRQLAVATNKELESILFNLLLFMFNWYIQNHVSHIVFKLTQGSELDNI